MANTQALQNSYMETSTVSQTPAREAKSDSNMKKLNDLISRRNIITEINRIDSEPLPDTMPPYSAETGKCLNICLDESKNTITMLILSYRIPKYKFRGWLA